MAHVEKIEVVVAHDERVTPRVGDVFLKIDADQARTEVEFEAMAMAPVPSPRILWRTPPVLALTVSQGPHSAASRSRRPRRRRGPRSGRYTTRRLPERPGRSVEEEYPEVAVINSRT